MLRATFRSLLARKLRLLLSALAVVIGVSFVSGALVLTDTLGRVFDNLFVSVTSNTDVEIRGVTQFQGHEGTTRAPVPAAVLARVRSLDGVVAATGDVMGFAQVVGKDGAAYSPGGPPTFGQNYDAEPALSPYTLRSGTAPQRPGEVALDARTAARTGYTVGDTVPILTPQGRQDYRLSGVFGFGSNDNLGGASISAFAQDQAERLFAPDGTYASIRVAGAPGIDQAGLRSRIAAVLPASVEAVTGATSAQDQADQITSFFGFFRTFLLVFAGIALFVGAFLIFNTFTILVAQRQRELALLRALGASKGQVTGSVLLEAVVVGLVASVLGLAAGIGVARLLQALINRFGGALPSTSVVVALRTVLVSLLVGLLVTVLASLLPARRAAAVPPVAAMREVTGGERSLLPGSVLGGGLLAVGCLLLAVGLQGRIVLVGVGALLAFLGVAGLSPLLARPVGRVVGWPMARGVPGRLGRLNAIRNPRRSAATAAALMIGLALVTAVGVLGASIKASVAEVVQGSVGADVIVQSSGFQGFPPQVAQQVSRVAGVGAVDRLRQDSGRVAGAVTTVTALDPAAIGRGLRLTQVEGRVRALGPGTLLVSRAEAADRALRVGDQVAVQLARGERSLRLVGVYADNQLAGDALLSLADAADFAASTDAVLLVSARRGADPDTVLTAVRTATAPYPTVQVLDRSGFVADVSGQVDVVLSIVTVLLALSVLIAVLGIVNTLALAVLERTRELGLLRAVGLGRRQTRRMVRVEAVILAVFGALLGIAVGAVLGVAVQRALAGQGITELRFPVGRLVLFVLVGALAGVLAAVLPARRAARLDVLQAIATA